MKRILLTLVAFCALPCSAAEPSTDRDLLRVVHGFYGWVLRDGEAVNRLQPTVKQIPGTNRLNLDTSTLPKFISKFMHSGYFADSFPNAVNRYYENERAKLDALSDEDLARLAKDGRGPMMDTENIDIFFCAQEYEYKRTFVRQLRVASAQVSAAEATAIIVSPLGSETKFRLTKVKGNWRIAGYCVYQ